MGIKNLLKKGGGSGLSPSRWMGLGYLKSNVEIIMKLTKSVFLPSKKSYHNNACQSYQELLQRYELSDEEMQERKKLAKVMAISFLAAGILLFTYMVYQFCVGHVLGGFLSMTLALILMSYALQQHFIYFQIQQQRISTSLKDWFRHYFTKARTS